VAASDTAALVLAGGGVLDAAADSRFGVEDGVGGVEDVLGSEPDFESKLAIGFSRPVVVASMLFFFGLNIVAESAAARRTVGGT